MQVLEIMVGSTPVSLRLTASKLQSYIKENGNDAQSPLLAVLDAVESLKQKAALFTAALQFKGNSNTVKDGYELLDMLADAGYTPLKTKQLIIQLAEQSGLVDPEDADTVREAIEKGNRKFINTVAMVLAGDAPDSEPAATDGEPQEENPT